MELVDLLPLDEWEMLENELRAKSGLAASVFNVDGVRITANPFWPNKLCPEIKANPKGQSFICATAHMNIANMAKEAKKPVIEECDAGFVKMVVPIFVDDTFLGAVASCGLLLDDGEVDSFLVNKITDMDVEKIENLAQGAPSIKTEAAEALNTYIVEKLRKIVDDYKARSK